MGHILRKSYLKSYSQDLLSFIGYWKDEKCGNWPGHLYETNFYTEAHNFRDQPMKSFDWLGFFKISLDRIIYLRHGEKVITKFQFEESISTWEKFESVSSDKIQVFDNQCIE